MNKLTKRVLSVVMSCAMVLGLTAVTPAEAKAAEDLSGKLVVIHTNDMHGYYETDKTGEIGRAHV